MLFLMVQVSPVWKRRVRSRVVGQEPAPLGLD
jgi:hypothetical protein